MDGRSIENAIRTPAVHAFRAAEPDDSAEVAMAERLRAEHSRAELVDLAQRFANGATAIDAKMRRIAWRALAARFGNGVRIECGVGFSHPEIFEIGDGAFIGAQSYVQGWHEGRFVIGDHVWIGPQSYFDARDIMIGDYVGWGPGAKILTSTHTGRPRDIPIIKSDLTIRPVRIEAWADVGTGAMVMPGVTVGRGSIVGAGAVVTKDVPPFAVVAGVPARFVRWREDEPDKDATHPAESSESRDSGLAPAMSVENRALNGR